MPDIILVKELKASRFKDRELRRLLRNAVFRIGRRAKRDFERTTKTWEHEVHFQLLTQVRAPEIVAIVGTDDRIYRFLNDGTSIRYATMTDDFSPKTQPGVLGSRPGQGGLAFVNTSVPRPGIEARGWDKIIQKKYQTQFLRAMEDAMRQAARLSGHGE